MINTKRIVKVHYEGECPICKQSQYGKQNEVDILCLTCKTIKNISPDSKYKSLEENIIQSMAPMAEVSKQLRKLNGV